VRVLKLTSIPATPGPPTFASACSRKLRIVNKLSVWKASYVTVLVCAAMATASPAQTFKTLVNFDSSNGATPVYTSLVQGTDGDFYGTTIGGGANGSGTVFKITSGGTLTTLYSFCSQANCTDGASPYGGLTPARDGNFYGTTFSGGANGDFGTVFKVTPGGTLTTLHSFDLTDGAQPEAALVQATSGDFYGTTSGGGPNNAGAVFKITPRGALKTLHTFDGSDGSGPVGAMVQGTNESFYGTTPNGGAFLRFGGEGIPCAHIVEIFLYDDVAAGNKRRVFVADEDGIGYGGAAGILRAIDEPQEIALVEVTKAVHLIHWRNGISQTRHNLSG
jgi:uncharacterized repeat protein (TIGR03803 family)